MPEIKVKHIVTFSSEDPQFPADNILKCSGSSKWISATSGEKALSVILQLEKASSINQIDIGNSGSAFIEVLVGRSGQDNENFQVILAASSFMNPSESRSNTNANRVRIFSEEKLAKSVVSEKWDRVKVVCTQPFLKSTKYGISFIVFHSNESHQFDSSDTKKIGAFKMKSEVDVNIKPGLLFAQKKVSNAELNPSGSACVVRAPSSIIQGSPITLFKGEGNSSNSNKTVSKTLKNTPDESSMISERDKSNNVNMSCKNAVPKKRLSDCDNSPASTLKKHKIAVRALNDTPLTEVVRERVQNNANETKNPNKTFNTDKTKNVSSTVSSEKKEALPPKSLSTSKYQSTSKGAQLKVSKSKNARNLPFHQLLRHVTFVLSGFQNPYRSDLRDKALKMGAKYQGDWSDSCTHLICAFANTPKYQQVKGHGKIVKKEWIEDCFLKKSILPWRNYCLGSSSAFDSSSEESDSDRDMIDSSVKKPMISSKPETSNERNDVSNVNDFSHENGKEILDQTVVSNIEINDESDMSGDTDDEIEQLRQKKLKEKKMNPYTISTEEEISSDEDNGSDVTLNSSNEVPSDSEELHNEVNSLGNFFNESVFFIFNKIDTFTRRQITRYVIAYGGEISDYMKDNVKYVISEAQWDEHCDEALANNSNLVFVKPAWVFSCHDNQKCVPSQKYLVPH